MKHRKGQSTVEYAIIIAVIISALLVMQFYMRRGVMGKLREGTDQIGEQFNPFEHSGNVTRTFIGTRDETTTAQGSLATANIDEAQGQRGSEVNAEALDSSPLFR